MELKILAPPFINVVQDYINYYVAENELAYSTRQNYQSYFGNIADFLTETAQQNLSTDQVTPDLVYGFRMWMRTGTKSKRAKSITTTSRAIEICQRAVKYAVKRKLAQENLIEDVKTPRSKVKDVIALAQNELEKMWNDASKTKEEEIAIDLYTLQCETGQSYGDLWSYRIEDRDELGEWLYNTRNKTGRHYGVPFTQTAKNIHVKYSGNIPRPSNRLYNEALQRVAERTIHKHLTTHTARKTFATRMYNQGWSLPSIADMMGITVITLTTHYILKSLTRVENEFKARMTA